MEYKIFFLLLLLNLCIIKDHYSYHIEVNNGLWVLKCRYV